MDAGEHRNSAWGEGQHPVRAGQAVLTDQDWMELARSLSLSARELAILRLIMEDRTQEGIALQLGISPHTVHTHLERLYRKLGVASRCAAIVRVFEDYVQRRSNVRETGTTCGEGDGDGDVSAERATA